MCVQSSYSMTPSMAVVDPQLVMQLPRAQTAYGGQLTLSHALESYISVFASGAPSLAWGPLAFTLAPAHAARRPCAGLGGGEHKLWRVARVRARAACADYSKSLSKHALAMMNRYYARAYRNGPMDYHAREKVRPGLRAPGRDHRWRLGS